MPVVARFGGIKIEFYSDEHPPPHFHATYAEHVAQVRIDPPGVIKGSLPRPQLRAVIAWASKRREELMLAWSEAEARRKPRKIDG